MMPSFIIMALSKKYEFYFSFHAASSDRFMIMGKGAVFKEETVNQ